MDFSKAPETGVMYAIYKDRVEFQHYEGNNMVDETNLLELHLFDETMEYRYVKGRTKEFESIVSDASVSFDDIYGGAPQKIKIVNYITYDENDLIHIENYRMAEVK